MSTIVTAVKGIVRYDNRILIVQRAAADSATDCAEYLSRV